MWIFIRLFINKYQSCTDVVRDRHQRGTGEILLASRGSLFNQIHLAEAARDCRAGEAESRVVAAVNISHELVHFLVITFGRQFQGLFERITAGEQAAEAQEGPAT